MSEVRGEGREAIISVRLSPREEKEIREAAAKSGEPVSAFVRDAALKTARPGRRIGASWSTTTTTVGSGSTVLPRYEGMVEASRPASKNGTAAASAEPISRAR